MAPVDTDGAKPTVERLGIDLEAQHWQRSGAVRARSRCPGGRPSAADAPLAGDGDVEWVLMRVSGDADGRVLVYDRHEWECFLDGVRNGEFDGAAG